MPLPPPLPPSTNTEIDAALEALQGTKDAWIKVGIPERIRFLDTIAEALQAVAEEWVRTACKAKDTDFDAPLAGEEWLGGPLTFMRNLRLLKQSLLGVERSGKPRVYGKITTLPDGRAAAEVLPADFYDTLLYKDFTATLRMKDGVTPKNLAAHQAHAYSKDAPTEGKVALVLGAGNTASIGPMDALHKLFQENQVVILKMNPVNEYTGPFIEKAFKCLIDRNFLRVVYGGAAEGDYLCHHEHVDEIHITGSVVTHDIIVYGPGEEGAKRKADQNPRLNKRITSELGNVSPVIVVPGPWSQGDLQFQGENLATMLCNNAGYNCNGLRVIITKSDWNLKNALLDEVEQVFSKTPLRTAFYPGTEKRFDQFVEAHPDAKQFGERDGNRLPWTIVRDVDAGKADEICLTTESFCSVTSELSLEAASIPAYLEEAVKLCNERIWGTLNATLIVHPKSLEDPAVAAAVEKAIDDLRYGTVVVNHWAALGYGFVSTPWGAYPGHELHDIQSGQGFVHNTFMFEDIEKSVIRGPFKPFPKPAWFTTNKTVHRLAPKLLDFEREPSLLKLPGILWEALRG